MSLGGETEVALNPASEGLNLRQIDGADPPPPPHPYTLNRGGLVGGATPENNRGQTRERSSSSSLNSFYGGDSVGRKRSYDEGGGGGGLEFVTRSPKAARMFNHRSPDQNLSPAAFASSSTMERPEDLSRVDPVPKREVVLDDDGEVIHDEGDGGGGSGNYLGEHGIIGGHGEHGIIGGHGDQNADLSIASIQGSAVALMSDNYHSDSLPRPDPVSFANSIEELDQYFAVSDKVLAVKSIPIDKLKGLDSTSQSFEYKLFTSTLYDISKLAARCSPSFDKKNPSSKAHFHNIFERVWTEFSFLELLAQLGIQPKNGFSMRNFVRATMQKTYGHILDKLLSNSLKMKDSIMA